MPYQISRDRRMTLWQRLYLPGVVRAMLVTARHFIRNFIRMDDRMTVEYPEQRRPLAGTYRGMHRLMRREDGSTRCSACMLCPAICPANCINIEAEEVADPNIEKRAKSFSIDYSRCVFCGFCVDVCPCDAVRMDSGLFGPVVADCSLLLYNIEGLHANTPAGASTLSRAL